MDKHLEKLVKEQTSSAKTDLDLANCKLKNLIDDIRALEEILNEKAMLKGKHWKELESKFSSTKTLCDQLTDTLQHLASQLQDAERDNLLLDNLHEQLKSMSLRNQGLEDKVTELQKEQEFAVVQHAEERHLAEEKIRRLESEAETLHSQKSEMEAPVTKLQENAGLSESKMVKERALSLSESQALK